MLWAEPGCPAPLLAAFGLVTASAEVAQGGQRTKKDCWGQLVEIKTLSSLWRLLPPLLRAPVLGQERTGSSVSVRRGVRRREL